ncbi:hypothetical protein BDZ89DRAFT_963654, partial [Hymenopellis radicata]
DMLRGLAARCKTLGVPLPEMCIIDNCCTARGTLQGALPSLLVFNDIWHIIARYLATILNGTRNPARDTVMGELSGALLKKRSKDGSGAEYFSKEDQERNLNTVYEKWAAKGNVWSTAAPKVHSDQVAHARKGCLTRSRQDILSDGSRIEGSHKGWNSIMRSQPSGIVMFLALASDFVLRRNVRAASKRTDSMRRFVTITARGSHHVRLVNYIARRFNAAILLQKAVSPTATLPVALPILKKILTTEVFGVVSSSLAGDFFEERKTESSDNDLLALAAEENEDLENSEITAPHLDIDPTLLLTPQYQPVGSSFDQQRSSADNCSQSSVSASSISVSSVSTSSISALSQVTAPLPVSTTGMTASQTLFALASGVQPTSLKIGKGDEFFLFMDMRSEQQWASFAMNPSKWLDATRQYNTRLQEKNATRSSSTGEGAHFVSKSPHALMDKLGDVEATILKRIATENYKSTKGNEDFWRKHCGSVQLIKTEATDECKQRKIPTCTRCKTLMYANGLKGAGNHKKGYCSDGVRQKASSILWPQPEGIFAKGTDFSPIKLLESIRGLCERLGGTTISDPDLSMEDSALLDLLQTRLKTVNRQMVFTLVDGLEMPTNVPDTLFITIEGVRYLRVDCLSPHT